MECLLLNSQDTLLVRGATSTVGQASIQLAKALGAKVIGACRRASSFDRLKAIGADYVTTYGLRENSHSDIVQNVVTMDDLFKE